MTDAERADYLQAVSEGSAVLTLSGLTVSGPMLMAVLAAMPHTVENPSGQPRPIVPSAAFFDETRFTDYIDAQHVTFRSFCTMMKAVFQKGTIWNGSQFLGGLNLSGAVINGPAKFSHVTVSGDASWVGLESSGRLNFVSGAVAGNLDLRYARCSGAWLAYTVVKGTALFEQASFAFQVPEMGEGAEPPFGRFDGLDVGQRADFSNVEFPYETTFGGYSDMPPAVFHGTLVLRGSTFGNPRSGGRHLLSNLTLAEVDLADCTFYGRVSFSQTTFNASLKLSNVRVVAPQEALDEDDNRVLFPSIELDLAGLRLENGAILTDIDVEGSVALSFARLEGEFEVARLRCSRDVSISSSTFGYFPFEAHAGGRVLFSRCLFSRGGVISCASTSISFVECDARQPLAVVSSSDPPAAVRSLDRTNVQHFLLHGGDLSRVFFAGVNNLDKLRIQGTPRFLRSPQRIGRGRQVIQDEVMIRAQRSKRWCTLLEGTTSVPSDPEVVASVYRALRKNREDSKDAPGGADFYYGEMEMRRLASRTWSAEGILLGAYFLTSGYALRAWRAMATLVFVLLSGAALLQVWGYEAGGGSNLAEELLLLAQTSLALARVPDKMTEAGVTIVIAGRLLCPALLALAVFALRGRVKR